VYDFIQIVKKYEVKLVLNKLIRFYLSNESVEFSDDLENKISYLMDKGLIKNQNTDSFLKAFYNNSKLNKLSHEYEKAFKKVQDALKTHGYIRTDKKINGETETFLHLLGFENKVYKDDSIYTAENISAFNIEKVYIYIPNIDKSKPICSINSDLEVEMLFSSDKVISKLDCVIIQIKDEMTSNNTRLHNFCGTPPKLELKFKN
jgi:hypothetical protein